jgi:hypothetical protein
MLRGFYEHDPYEKILLYFAQVLDLTTDTKIREQM